MRRRALILVCGMLVISNSSIFAQRAFRTMLRLYDDNDFMNIWGNGADRGYSNGTRIDVFYLKNHPSRFFIDRWLPKAGDSSVNTFGWGIMQVIYTPNDLHLPVPDQHDFPYSGSLYASHTLHSSNAAKQYNLQSELIMGVIGPPSLARQTQLFVHRLINFQKPRGWAYQLPADVLLNLNVTGEKLLAHNKRNLEWIGGAQLFGGTALNGAALHTLLRFGKMKPYFDGLLSQYTGRFQWYFIVKPSVEWLYSNAFLEGGLFTQAKKDALETRTGEVPAAGRERIVTRFTYGSVLALGGASISFTQTIASALIKGIPGQSIGNLSLYYSF